MNVNNDNNGPWPIEKPAKTGVDPYGEVLAFLFAIILACVFISLGVWALVSIWGHIL